MFGGCGIGGFGGFGGFGGGCCNPCALIRRCLCGCGGGFGGGFGW
jgi:hypothetical protein